MNLRERAEKLIGALGYQKDYDESSDNLKLAFLEVIESALREVRNEAINDCIKQLGGRYGAAAKKDLSMLIETTALAASGSEEKGSG